MAVVRGCVHGSLGGNAIGDEGGAALVRALRAHPGALVDLDGVVLRECGPDLPLELLEGAGHCPHDEQPEAFNTAVLAWLGEQGLAGGTAAPPSFGVGT